MRKEEWKDKAAGKIADKALKWQAKVSAWMSNLLSAIPPVRLKTIVFIFCLGGGGFSAYLIANAILSKPNTIIKIEKIHLLKQNRTAHEEIRSNYIDSSLYQQIQDYKRFMDSTKQIIRPSLLDSIRILEEIYLSQQIK